MEHVSDDHGAYLNQDNDSHELCKEKGGSPLECEGKSMETETTWSEFA